MSAVLLVGLLTAGGYGWSVWRRPLAVCRACQGSGKNHGLLLTRAYRPCPRCHGRGGRLRWGATLLGHR